MAPPSFDFSCLLCTEDSSILDENDLGGSMEDETEQFDEPIEYVPPPLLPPPLLSEENLKVLIEKECHHLPASDYVNRLKNGELDLQGRMESIDWMEKAGLYFGFGPLCIYLAIRYMDRFLSVVDMLKERKWSIQLLAFCCLYLAAKIDEVVVPRSVDMQMDEKKYLFDKKTLRTTELLILSTLNWRMQAITPFSYIDFFLNKVNGDQVPIGDSILQSFRLIMSTVRGLDFIQFRPSEIAAAVAVLVSVEGENLIVQTEKALSLLIEYVEKEKVMKCIEMIQQLLSGSGSSAKDANVSVPFVAQTPIGVLDALCLSYNSDDNHSDATTAPLADSPLHNSPDAKRKKTISNFEE
ncbi:putative cyclin [Medicago truncatula]|uniref:B-like cyclin n=2 Tax=Medicago truncatula TaxID=3880 RepID=G7KBI0_MEDTR|nr:carboxy-terminal domain cyclin [Medicago truncatula]RHN56227.1 putative cyclin [Medicago truncatula]